MFHLLVSYLQTPAQPLIRGNLYSRDSCLGPEGVPWKEVPLYNFNPLFLLFILINFASILGTQLCVIVILNLKQWKIKFEVRDSLSHNISTLLLGTVRALSKSQNWPAGPWPHPEKAYFIFKMTGGHFENEIGFFHEFLMKNDFLRAYYLGFDWSGWIALIKGKILITKGMSWPVSSDKWKAP